MVTVSRKRHILKTLTWRVIATTTTFILAWLISGDIEIGLTVGGAEAIVKMFIYYFHERLWYNSKFGVTEDSSEDSKLS